MKFLPVIFNRQDWKIFFESRGLSEQREFHSDEKNIYLSESTLSKKKSINIFLIIWLAFFSSLSIAEQYRSRVYIDLDQDITENVSLSVTELEKQINTFQDDYTRSNAEQFLAKHYASQKDYPKAIEHIESALAHPGMTDSNRRSMYEQLSRLYLLQKEPTKAASALQKALAIASPNDSASWVLLAQLHYKNKNYVDSAAALDKALKIDTSPPSDLLQNALGIYYSIGNYDRAAKIVQQLLERNINDAALWQQWISIYLKAGKRRDALDVMSLAWEKGIAFREQDILLLTDLYSLNKIPGRGARVLEAGIQSGRIQSNRTINERLFSLWLQAGEREQATKALEKAALAGGDKDLQLHLAQLYMEQEQWQKMYNMVLKACDSPLPDALVSRSNLLLGISQLKLNDTELARRSFINATYFGGEAEKANQWLSYMQAEPANKREKAGVAGPCYSTSSRSMFTEDLPDSNRNSPEKSDQTEDVPNKAPAGAVTTKALSKKDLQNKQGDPKARIDVKTAPSQKLYIGAFAFAADEFEAKLLPNIMSLALTATKNGGTIKPPLHIIFPEPPSNQDRIKVQLAFPVSGRPKSAKGFKLINSQGFKCVWRPYRGPKEGVPDAFAQLYLDAQVQGYQFTGESRQLAGEDNNSLSETISLELQIGIE